MLLLLVGILCLCVHFLGMLTLSHDLENSLTAGSNFAIFRAVG